MKDIVKFLEDNPVQFLATVGRDGGAKCRPFMFCLEKNNHLWFCTNSTKRVYAELLDNPYVEISAINNKFEWIRISGKVVFENNSFVKEACIQNPIVKQQYHSAENPIFEVFYIDPCEAIITDALGNLTKVLKI